MRTFLWQHWQGRTRARVTFISTIRRGLAPGTTHLFVEPGEAGVWRVAMEQQGNQPVYFGEVGQIRVDASGLPLAGQNSGGGGDTALRLTPTSDGEPSMVF